MGILAGVVLVGVAVALLVVVSVRQRRRLSALAGAPLVQGGQAGWGGVQPPFQGTTPTRKLGGAEWVEAGPSLEALGLTKLNAETYMGKGLFVSLEVREASVAGWLEGACEGGAFEAFLGANAELGPGGDGGRSELARFVAGEVRDVLDALPRGARLTIKAPEMPGDKHNFRVETPFCSLDGPSLVARVLLRLDETARRPAPAGAHAQLPPAATAWQAARAPLEALGLTKLNAETFMGHGMFVSVDVKDATVAAWVEQARAAPSRRSWAPRRS